MNFLDGALFPENQEKLVITAAPYGPEWLPRDFPEDIAVSMKDQVQKAVDCYNAGASVLHLHVRELDGSYVLHTQRPPQAIVSLVKHLETEGNELVSLEIAAPSLEDVFIEMTGRRLRD